MRRPRVFVWKIVVAVVAIFAAMLAVRSCLYERYKSACLEIAPGTSLKDAAGDLESAGGKHVAHVDDVHQWLRVRLSLKHQNCSVKVDSKDRVISTKYEDSWDLL